MWAHRPERPAGGQSLRFSGYIYDGQDRNAPPGRQKLRAIWAGNPEQTDIVKEILDRSSSLEAVFECCGDQEAIDQALELLTPGGTLLILGIPEEDRLYFNAHTLRRKEIDIQNVRRQNQCTSRALELIADKKIDVDFLGTHTFPLEKTQEAFELVSNYGDGVIKAMISLS